MHAVVFNTAEGTGTLFPLLDSILSGALCFLSVSGSRVRALEVAGTVFDFILEQFGKDHDVDDNTLDWEICTTMYKELKNALRNEKKAVASDKAVEKVAALTTMTGAAVKGVAGGASTDGSGGNIRRGRRTAVMGNF